MLAELEYYNRELTANGSSSIDRDVILQFIRREPGLLDTDIKLQEEWGRQLKALRRNTKRNRDITKQRGVDAKKRPRIDRDIDAKKHHELSHRFTKQDLIHRVPDDVLSHTMSSFMNVHGKNKLGRVDKHLAGMINKDLHVTPELVEDLLSQTTDYTSARDLLALIPNATFLALDLRLQLGAYRSRSFGMAHDYRVVAVLSKIIDAVRDTTLNLDHVMEYEFYGGMLGVHFKMTYVDLVTGRSKHIDKSVSSIVACIRGVEFSYMKLVAAVLRYPRDVSAVEDFQ